MDGDGNWDWILVGMGYGWRDMSGRIFVTRHAQPFLWKETEDPQFPFGDAPLTELGHEQARVLGGHLRGLGFRGVIHSSPYRRTLQTALEVAEEVSALVVPQPAIREVQNAGIERVRGMKPEEIEGLSPRIRLPEGFAFPWWDTVLDAGEGVQRRVSSYLDGFLTNFSGGDHLFVGHGASVWAISHHLLGGRDPILVETQHFWNAGLSEYEVTGSGEVRMVAFNEHGHLEPAKVTSNSLFPFRDQAAAGD